MSVTAPQVAPPRAARRSLLKVVAAETKRHARRRLVWLALSVVSAAGVVALWVALRPHPAPMAVRFRSEAATVGDVVREVRATGHVEAVTTVQVGAEISGRITTVEVDYNDRVRVGQVLARFDREALLAQQAQALGALASARAALEQAKTDREHTARDFERQSGLHARGSISDEDFDTALATKRTAAEKVVAADANLAAQEAASAVARTNLDHAVIRAPIDGIVITRNVDPGQTVASAFETPVLFTVAADLRKMRVIAAVDEADIGEVASQQRASFTVNAYPNRTFEGVVTEVRNSPVVVQDVVTYGAIVLVDNTDLALKPGMTATVRVRTASAPHTLHVPSAALRFSPPTEKKTAEPSVWRLDGETLVRIPVTPGLSDGEVTAIAAGPVAPGQAVLVDLTPEGKKAYGLAH